MAPFTLREWAQRQTGPGQVGGEEEVPSGLAQARAPAQSPPTPWLPRDGPLAFREGAEAGHPDTQAS